eukprot:TRINITY_DN32047_c0_g1_i1.p1 TRINITY_DN32047_c0_g1~~TRINITY_DN32047_c0_g1_i1.p1  ORF type:complete len:201 (+),score=8.81 TRINITY_DN32047_c0_g1_i1:220-822(+)
MTFWVSCAHFATRTALDYQMELVTVHSVPERDDQIALFGWMGLLTAILTTTFSCIGTRQVWEIFGLRFGLQLLPCATIFVTCGVCCFPGFFSIQAAPMFVNLLAYGLNAPSVELLYVQTSRTIKYKAKSWSDMYGNLLAKAVGAQFNYCLGQVTQLHHASWTTRATLLSFSGAWALVWLCIARSLGSQYTSLLRMNKKVQ